VNPRALVFESFVRCCSVRGSAAQATGAEAATADPLCQDGPSSKQAGTPQFLAIGLLAQHKETPGV